MLSTLSQHSGMSQGAPVMQAIIKSARPKRLGADLGEKAVLERSKHAKARAPPLIHKLNCSILPRLLAQRPCRREGSV